MRLKESGRRGGGGGIGSGTSLFNDPLQKLNGFIQQVRGAAHCHLKLLHRLGPASFLPESLEPAMLFMEDGLLCVEHQVIRSAHGTPPINERHRNRLLLGFARAVGRKSTTT